jgi:hypothetical protein
MEKLENTILSLNRDRISQKDTSYIFLDDYNFDIIDMTERENYLSKSIIDRFRLDLLDNDEIVIICSPKQLVDMILMNHRKL